MQGVDICLCLGDLTDRAPTDTKESVAACFHEALALIRSYHIPFYLVPGNHDYLMLTKKELETAGIPIPPYTVSMNGWRFIILDANYRSNGDCFDIAGVEWTDSNLPADQCDFLKEALKSTDEKCIVCIHENLDPYVESRHIVKNAEAVRSLLGSNVKMVLQGHYHHGAEHTIDQIPYLTLRAMCEGEENTYTILSTDELDEFLLKP